MPQQLPNLRDESDTAGSLTLPNLNILQGLWLLKYLISGKLKRDKMRLELVSMLTNILFCDSVA